MLLALAVSFWIAWQLSMMATSGACRSIHYVLEVRLFTSLSRFILVQSGSNRITSRKNDLVSSSSRPMHLELRQSLTLSRPIVVAAGARCMQKYAYTRYTSTVRPHLVPGAVSFMSYLSLVGYSPEANSLKLNALICYSGPLLQFMSWRNRRGAAALPTADSNINHYSAEPPPYKDVISFQPSFASFCLYK